MTVQSRDEAIFLAAMEKPTLQERVAFVEGACGDDEALLNRVRALLDSHEATRGPLDSPPPGLGAGPQEPPITEQPGATIGPYKLLEQIGEGGFGVVYLAEQNEPVRRRVALKIIKPGMDSKQVIARFEAERQALAMMDHQHIARVLDAGTTESGRPYFVMELVKGVPITQYCDAHKLTVRERLELFIPVCQAIQHAHQKGIIHRDVKPSNVLVCLYDGKPVPKVIDFGVAKAIEQRLTEKTMFTQHGQIIGTLEYMSPEQAELSQLDVDTRSDIYSLGVLLYELLTGTTPITKEQLRTAAYVEMLCIIREMEPEKPSTRLSHSQKLLPAISAQRRTEPAKLGALVRGDLDWIVMKALEKDRTRRYESASSLAKDVQRYLSDEAVEARPPSVIYRFRKFARRNRGVLAGAAAIAAVMVVGSVVSVWQAVRATRAEQAAVAERESARKERDRAQVAEGLAEERLREAELARRRADQEREIAQAVHDFVRGDLMGYDEIAARPRGERGMDPGLGFPELLDRASRALDDQFSDHPLSEAAVRLAIGDNYRMLRDFATARRHIERSVQLRTENLGPTDASTLESKWQLAELFHDEGEHDLAEPLLLEVLEGFTNEFGADHASTLTCMNSLALLYHDQEDYKRAEAIYREALQLAKTSMSEDDDLALVLKSNLAGLHRNERRYDQAAELYQQVLSARVARLGADHHKTQHVAEELAFVYRSQEKHDDAEALLAQLPQARRAGPFRGPINAALATTKSVILITPTNEENDSDEKKVHAHAQFVRDHILAIREATVITDQEALERDLSNEVLMIYGTPSGNLWLARHVPQVAALVETGSKAVLKAGETAEDLRFITTLPNPFNRDKGMVVYTSLRAENIYNRNGINSVFHGPYDYVIARGRHILRSGNYFKVGGQWTMAPQGPATEPSGPAEDAQSDRVGNWQGELDVMVDCLKTKHWNAFFKIGVEEFDAAVAGVRERIPELDDYEVLMEFYKLVALVGDSHTTIHPGGEKYAFRRYPVSFVWASDGLFVDAAAEEHRSLLRAKVVGFGKVGVEEAVERVVTLNAKENDSGAQDRALRWLNCPEALAALEIVDDMERASLTVKDASGERRQVLLRPMAAGEAERLIPAFDASAEGVFISRRRPRERYGHVWLAKQGTLYCWYDQCTDLPDQPVSAWCKEVLRDVDARPVERVVIDLRENGGGNSLLLNPLIAGLRQREAVNQKGKLFVLIGRDTYSSAMLNAWELRDRTNALLVGLPTGGSPNAPGEIKREALPHSGWLLQYSTKWFGLTQGNMGFNIGGFRFKFRTGKDDSEAEEPDSTVAPDVLVESSSADYFAGRDPVLEAAIGYDE